MNSASPWKTSSPKPIFKIDLTLSMSIWARNLLEKEARQAAGSHENCWDKHCIPNMGGPCPAEADRIKRTFRGRRDAALPRM